MKTKRSLQASPEGIAKAKAALISHSLTQQQLASDLGISRQPVNKFFQGKPIERYIFFDICEQLDLDWNEIVASSWLTDTEDAANLMPIDSLVKEMREKIKPSIQERCSTIRVLDMSKPMELNKIYTPVYISEKISAKRCLDIEQLIKDYEKYDNFAFLSTETFPGVEVVNRYSKLIIFGKAGGGKTTFLKYLALQSVENNFYSHLVPIFISLREFAEATNKPGLSEYVVKIIEKSYYPREDKTNVTELLLNQGRFFILLDSLDEIPIDDNIRVLKEIQNFSECFPRNKFVITSRLAAHIYIYEKFTEVELADFDDEQISNFADNWFKNASDKSKSFIKSLESNAQIKRLAKTPLLLVLLCLIFEEIGYFKNNNYDFYQEVANIFFIKWDLQRGIQRQTIYSKLTKEQKEYLLGFIAIGVLELGKYLFTENFVKKQINFCISNPSSYSDKVDILQINSEEIFKSIVVEDGLLAERGQGIYSFSYMTLYEYFAAKTITHQSPSKREEVLDMIITLNRDKHDHNIYSLVNDMLSREDYKTPELTDNSKKT